MFDQVFNLNNDINDRLREQKYSSKDSLVKKPALQLKRFRETFHEFENFL